MDNKNNNISTLSIDNVDLEKIRTTNADIFKFEDIAIAKDINALSNEKIIEKSHIYRVAENRIMKITKGNVKARINLVEYELSQGDFLISSIGDLVEISNVSQDAQGCGVVYKNSSNMNFDLSHIGTCKLHPEEETLKQNTMLLDMLWQIANRKPFHSETFLCMFKTFVSDIYYMALEADKEQQSIKTSRSSEVFSKFLKLVNKYAKQERDTSFYADKLFLSPHYLASIIKKESGQTVMDWINKQVILEAKVMLKHSNKLVFEVSDELNFPNASFFNKFFKRITGMTPKQYKNS